MNLNQYTPNLTYISFQFQFINKWIYKDEEAKKKRCRAPFNPKKVYELG